MKTKDFYYELDESLIAQSPILNRSDSRMLVLDRNTGEIKHQQFQEIIEYLNPGDCLVLNDTKVIPARIIGNKISTNAIIELLLLNQNGDEWECLTKPARRIKCGDIITFGNDDLKAQCIMEKEEGIRIYKMIYQGVFLEILDKLGEMPLPPYIHQKLTDKERYQTVYAKNIGSSAAPTAGLHFTQKMLQLIKEKGIEIVYITLHVGLATFRPVMVSDINLHKMHKEYYQISEKSAMILNEAKINKKRIICVGTTVVRTLEAAYDDGFIGKSGSTEIFIYPGYTFKVVDALLTNFHLPESTLLMLVSAFSSKEIIMNAYLEAQKMKYRFFSFGDCMLIK